MGCGQGRLRRPNPTTPTRLKISLQGQKNEGLQISEEGYSFFGSLKTTYLALFGIGQKLANLILFVHFQGTTLDWVSKVSNSVVLGLKEGLSKTRFNLV